jgi:hypothetical protein
MNKYILLVIDKSPKFRFDIPAYSAYNLIVDS